MVLTMPPSLSPINNDEQVAQSSIMGCSDILNNAPVGIFSITPDGRYLFANPTLVRMFGHAEPKELVDLVTALSTQMYFDPAPRQEHLPPQGQSGQIVNYEGRRKRKDGSTFWISLLTWAVRDQERRITHYQGFAADITEWKHAEKKHGLRQGQLLEAHQMESMRFLVKGITHYLNNLLQTMLGNIQFLLMNKHKYHSDTERLQTVFRSIDKASQLVRQLQVFSLNRDSAKQRMDLSRKVQEVAGILQHSISKALDVKLHLEDQIWPISADPMQIEQVLLNLCVNAVNAMPEGGSLDIETRNVVLDQDFARTHPKAKLGKHVLLVVSDTGPGMDKATLDNIFDPFFSNKQTGQGSGLGLPNVYRIVTEHHGYIQCVSEPGQGTTYNIYLPILEDGDVSENGDPDSRINSLYGRETILIVDDENDIRELAGEALLACGYKVIAVPTGEEALEIYNQKGQSIHLVILDLNMPGVGGSNCLRKLLQLNPQALVLIASGYSMASQAREALQEGAAEFISKPYQITELLAKVREVLTRHNRVCYKK